MAEFVKKAYFKNSQGATQSAKIYTTLTEVQNQGISIIVDGLQGYIKYAEMADPNATSARIITKSTALKDNSPNNVTVTFSKPGKSAIIDNHLYLEESAFKAVVNRTLPITIEFTAQNTGNYGCLIYYLQGESDGIKLQLNLGTMSSFSQFTGIENVNLPKDTAWRHYAIVLEKTKQTVYVDGVFLSEKTGTFNGTYLNSLRIGAKLHADDTSEEYFKGFLGHFYITNGVKYSTNFTPSTPLPTDTVFMLGYSAQNNQKAILTQAQIPYGSQTYTSNGTFTVPAGITKLKVTVKGAGGGGGGSLWDIGDSAYLINRGGSGGRGGLNIQTITVTSGAQHPVTVGRGGMGGSNDRNSPAGSGVSGGSSSFLTVSATGGGGGGGGSYGSAGGSGPNGSPAGAGSNGGGGSGSASYGNGGSGADGSVLIEWGGDIV